MSGGGNDSNVQCADTLLSAQDPHDRLVYVSRCRWYSRTTFVGEFRFGFETVTALHRLAYLLFIQKVLEIQVVVYMSILNISE
jgi:hypothetical protein